MKEAQRRDAQASASSVGNNSACSKNEVFANDIMNSINEVLIGKYRRWSKSHIGQLISKVVWGQATFISHSERHARKHFRDKVFIPYNILR